MTETARPARASSDGSPCPSWCATDHGQHAWHSAGTSPIGTEGGYVMARAMVPMPGGPAVVAIGAWRASTQVWLARGREIEAMAAIVEELAGATPGQHRELAAQIREAAAQITEGSNG